MKQRVETGQSKLLWKAFGMADHKVVAALPIGPFQHVHADRLLLDNAPKAQEVINTRFRILCQYCRWLAGHQIRNGPFPFTVRLLRFYRFGLSFFPVILREAYARLDSTSQKKKHPLHSGTNLLRKSFQVKHKQDSQCNLAEKAKVSPDAVGRINLVQDNNEGRDDHRNHHQTKPPGNVTVKIRWIPGWAWL